MRLISENHPLRRLFAGLVEHAFCAEVGMCDPGLTNYIADLLVDFTHIDRLNTIRRAVGKRPEQIAAMLAVLADEKPASATDSDRSMYRHIGDYTLFWAGVYPEHLRSVHRGRADDVLQDYVSQGKRSYLIVSRLCDEDGAPPPSLFRHLSEDFEFCVYGLGLVRRGLQRAEERPPGRGGGLLY